MVAVVEFSTPTWLIYYLQFMGGVSFILNLGTIYLIVRKSERIDNFRYFLLLFQIICTQTDLQFTFLMQPIPLSPLLAGYCNGFLATHLKIWTHYLVSFLTTSFVAQIECLVFCFIRKHQTIARLNYRHILTDAWYVFGTLLAVSVPILIGVLLSFSGMPREDQMGYIQQNFPEYFVSFQSLPNFVIYAVNFRLILLLSLTIIGGLSCGIIFILLTTDMLKMLKKIQRKVSVVSFRRYQIAVTSLLAQFFTSFLLSVPLFLFLVLAASQAEHSHGAAKILVAVMPMYSVVNALVLVFTTPPYRNFVLRFVSSEREIEKK